MDAAPSAASDMFGLTGKTAVVIGAGQGMGEASALTLARAGCDIIAVDLDGDRAAHVVGQIEAMGRRAAAIVADVLDPANAGIVVRDARAAFGRLDVMVNIVGQALFHETLDITPEQWDLDHNRNLRQVFFLAQQFARSQIAEGKPGSIVAIASTSGIQAAVSHAAYGAAKAGLINLTKTLAVEWARRGIRVNAIAPGAIVTPRAFDTPEKREAFMRSGIPMARRGTVEEISRAVLFLASDLSTYSTGDTIHVDGGWLAANLWIRPGELP